MIETENGYISRGIPPFVRGVSPWYTEGGGIETENGFTPSKGWGG